MRALRLMPGHLADLPNVYLNRSEQRRLSIPRQGVLHLEHWYTCVACWASLFAGACCGLGQPRAYEDL